jgi:hypothetical protein
MSRKKTILSIKDQDLDINLILMLNAEFLMLNDL